MPDTLPNQPTEHDQIQLSEEEASVLAKELSHQLNTGDLPSADAEQIQKMVAGLGDKRGLMRLKFAESLGQVGKTAVPALCQALRSHKNVTVRRAAAKTLTLIGDTAALDDLLHALVTDSDPVVQGSAVGAMVVIGEEALDGLLSVLSNPNSTQMQLGMASWGLSFVGARAPDRLRKAATSSNVEIRTAAIAALGDQIQALEDENARDLLIAALNDEAADVRAEASTLLGKLDDAGWAEPLLTPRLSDSDQQVRKNAALALMKL
ncbi:MAG: HEAT repeat domain-containing protein, partial [Planctomycetaceae bacterium]|nr:HEAT repeat domain-containing protein [Planctomycetaceae bacterium]